MQRAAFQNVNIINPTSFPGSWPNCVLGLGHGSGNPDAKKSAAHMPFRRGNASFSPII